MLLIPVRLSQRKKKLLEFFFPHYNGKGLVQVAMMDSGVKWQKSAKN